MLHFVEATTKSAWRSWYFKPPRKNLFGPSRLLKKALPHSPWSHKQSHTHLFNSNFTARQRVQLQLLIYPQLADLANWQLPTDERHRGTWAVRMKGVTPQKGRNVSLTSTRAQEQERNRPQLPVMTRDLNVATFISAADVSWFFVSLLCGQWPKKTKKLTW